LKDQVDKVYVYEPLNPEQRIRPTGLPVGLKNIGNSNNLLKKPQPIF